MPETTTTSAAMSDGIQDAEPTLARTSAFISQQEVMFSTAAATSPRPAPISRRLIDAIRVAGAALNRPPARRHYPSRSSYLDHSRMAREMDRL